MAIYKKKRGNPIATSPPEALVLGMLFIVDIRMVRRDTGEKIKQKLLLVGCEQADIERKLRWIYDARQYMELSIKTVEKVREKVHVLSTVITHEKEHTGPVIEREERSQIVEQPVAPVAIDTSHLFAVGIITRMWGGDESHALRKVGRALLNTGCAVKSQSAPALSTDSTVTIEEIAPPNGYAMPRDVQGESNRAHIYKN